MTKLAQAYIHLKPYPASDRQVRSLGRYARRLAIKTAADIYGGGVEVEIQIEEGSLITRITVIGSLLFNAYARVSTDGQSVAAQVAELRGAGAAKVFAETASGAKTDRVMLARALGVLQPGDTLLVTRLDRLARSTRDLLNTLHTLAERSVGFKSLVDAWADTTTPHGRLMLTVLGGLAEFERDLIRARTGEGRKRAMTRGVRFGRPRKMTPHQRTEAIARLAAGETQADVARSYAVDATTIGRLRA